jgi:hypothetical protein
LRVPTLFARYAGEGPRGCALAFKQLPLSEQQPVPSFAAAIGFSLLALSKDTWKQFASPGLLPQILSGFFGAFAMLIAFGVGGLFLGFAMYFIAITPFRVLYGTLAWIDKYTDDGTIGILGFLLFLVGAILHAYVSWTAD